MGVYMMGHTMSQAWIVVGGIAFGCAIAFYALYTIERRSMLLKSDMESL